MSEISKASEPAPLVPCSKLAKLKLVCFDVDGVMTDGGLYYGPDGQVMLRFHVADGMGLKRLMAAGIHVCIISQSDNRIIASRAKALGITHCYLGVDEKLKIVKQLTQKLRISIDEVGHIADDVNDLSLLREVGVTVTVPAGVREVKNTVQFVTTNQGGNGAVREFCEAILDSRN